MKRVFTFIFMLFFSVLYTYLVGAQTSMLLVYMFVLCIPVSFFLSWPLRKRFGFSLEIPTYEVEKGSITKINILIRNNSFLPVPFVRLAFMHSENLILQDQPEELLSFSPHEEKTITARFYAQHRGAEDIGLSELSIQDYLGFFSFSLLKDLERHQYTGRITVLPKISVMKPSSKIMHGADGRENTMSESESVITGNNFFMGEPGHEFREYQAGDPLHKVHWKLSAKIDRLMVRKSESGGSSKLCFILDPFLTAKSIKVVKKKKASVTDSFPDKNKEAEDKLLETLLSVSNMVIQLGRVAEIWLFSENQWHVKCVSQKKELTDLQRYFAQYEFLETPPENHFNRLPLFSMMKQQKMNRSFKGSDAILFTAGYDQKLQALLSGNDLKGFTLRVIWIKQPLSEEAQAVENTISSTNELLRVFNTDENLSDAVI
ncbi:MAG: DUF58 domain-containing protein [Ruminiclostridium sp.]|nr:DUF58 domain-containing protein [Ruminiclostridium sp.]